MFKLEMRTPRRDAIRLLVGRLHYDEELQAAWLARGREPYLKHMRDWPAPADVRAVGGEAAFGEMRRRSQEDFFPVQDPTIEPVKKAAYAVEARRSLLTAVNDLTIEFAYVLTVASFAVGVLAGPVWGAVVFVAGSSIAVRLRRSGAARAVDAVPWRQTLEPLAWGLYYPTQQAQQILAAEDRLASFGTRSLRDVWSEAEGRIERAPDGHALPGQEAELADLMHLITIELPALLSAIDASRLLALSLIARADAAGELVRSECARVMHAGSRRSASALSEQLATRVYGRVMVEAAAYMTLPRPDDGVVSMDTPLNSIIDDATFRTLRDKAQDLLETAESSAAGRWPVLDSEWSRPTSRRWELAVSGAGLLTVILGLVLLRTPGWEQVGTAAIGIGAALVPGVLGRALKETTALRMSQSPGGASSLT